MEAQRLRRADATSGELATHPPEHLLLRAHAQKLTGTLEIGSASALDTGWPEASVVFQGGLVHKIKAVQALYLGGILYERGLIDTQTLNESLSEVARTKRPHGAILLARGAITPADLADALRDQMERRLAQLVALSFDLSWRFRVEPHGLSGYGGDDWPTIPPWVGVWRGIRESATDAQVSRARERLASHPVQVKQPFDATKYGFSGDELMLVAALREPIVATDLGAESPRLRAIAERMLYCLILSRELDVLDGAGRAAPLHPAHSGLRPSAMATPTPVVPGGSFSLKMPAVGGSGGYRVVNAPYAPSTPARIREEVTPVSLTMPADVQREAIRRRARGVEAEGYFRALGLEREATSVDVQEAYHRLSKIWHPDRLPAELRVVRAESAKVFAYLTKAYQTLTNDEERAAYVLELMPSDPAASTSGRTSGVMRAADPDVEFRAAERALAQGQRDRAELHARRAHDARPEDGDYASFLVHVESLRLDVSSDEHRIGELIKKLDDIIETSASTRAYWYRGLLHKRLDHARLAIRDFRDVLVLEPRHTDAEREIRLYEMRIRDGTLSVRLPSGETKVGSGGKGGPPRKDSVGQLIASWLKKS